MKKIVFMALCLCISSTVFAQHTENFKNLIKQTNEYFSIYETLSPFGGSCYTYKELGVTAEEGLVLFKEYYGQDAAPLNWMDDSLACADVAIQIIQPKIVNNINKIISHKDFNKYDITTLLTSDELSIIKSEDNKLYNFSFDAKNGGTYQMQVSIMHYTGYSLKSNVPDNKSKTGFQFADDGYSQIYTLYTKEGTKYLLSGFVRGCSQCFGSYVTLIAFKNNTFVQEFHYSMDLRTNESGIEYDPETKTISVNYQTDDLTPDCVCENESEEKDASGTEGPEQGTVDEVVLDTEQEVEDEGKTITRQCSCTFVFDGGNFQLKKKSSVIIETE